MCRIAWWPWSSRTSQVAVSVTIPNDMLLYVVNEGYRFPRRNGTTTIYLRQSQIAEAYRDRFAGLASRVDRAEHIERELVATLNGIDQVFALVSVVPDLPGDALINQVTFREFERSVVGRDPLLLSRGAHFQRATVRHRRFAAGSSPSNTDNPYVACELHEGGEGSFAAVVDIRRQDQAVTNGA